MPEPEYRRPSAAVVVAGLAAAGEGWVLRRMAALNLRLDHLGIFPCGGVLWLGPTPDRC